MNNNSANDISMQVIFEGIERDRLAAIEASARRIFLRIQAQPESNVVWTLKESVWPALMLPEFAEKNPMQIGLKIIPLGRIGQMEGMSGSLVVIGFFYDIERPNVPHSHPVVIKTLSTTKRGKLAEEHENSRSIRPFVYDRKDDFAMPIDFDDTQEGFHVLWSIFSPSSPIWPMGVSDSLNTSLKVLDLRTPLIRGEHNIAKRIIEDSFRLLRNLHLRLNQHRIEEREFGAEYERYLRKLDTGEWGAEWREVWADDNTTHINDAGSDFANPFWILKRLRPVKKPLFIGAVHGDLHPGNIVLTENDPRIIDFGWAKDNSHIAKDFALMECNLRFHTVRPQLNQTEVYALSDWLSWEEKFPEGLGAYTTQRVSLIQDLRNIAKSTFETNGTQIDWDWEYIVPLFFVAFGLLRVAPHLGNQQAAVRFVLALANHIERLLDREGV